MALKPIPKDNKGLPNLPKKVRNQMGFMQMGGMMKKPRMGNMDYRKGGMVVLSVDMMKKKGK
jgi:hypothetical protein|tara:strand:+ start:1587 stop:1772 length:186 start_codon:yes stop_codon:yes gene_type:complete